MILGYTLRHWHNRLVESFTLSEKSRVRTLSPFLFNNCWNIIHNQFQSISAAEHRFYGIKQSYPVELTHSVASQLDLHVC